MVTITNPYDGVGSIEYDPDENVSENDVIAHKSENHLHDRGYFTDDPHGLIDFLAGAGEEHSGNTLADDERYTVFGMIGIGDNEIRWPWASLSDIDADYEDRDPEQLGVVAYPGVEYHPDDAEHVTQMFSTNWAGQMEPWNPNRRDHIAAAVDEEEYHIPPENGGLALYAHANRYIDDKFREWGRYKPDFDKFSHDNGLLGFEIFNRQTRSVDDNINITFWDRLLTHYAPDRLIWAFGVTDAGTGDSAAEIGDQLNRWWTSVLLTDDEFDPTDQQNSRFAAAQAFRDGRLLAHTRESPWDPDTESPPKVPKVTEIDVNHETNIISLTTEDTATIEWVSRGDVVETGEQIEVDGTLYPYIRAQLRGTDDANTLTQPFGVDAPSSVNNASFGNATF